MATSGTSAAQLGHPTELGWYSLGRNAIYLAQLSAAIALAHHFEIEDRPLLIMLSLATAGFAISLLLPQIYRVPLFVGVSFCGIFAVLGFPDGAWLIALGLLLIGVCHLPLRRSYRVAAIVLTGVALAFARAAWTTSPWSSALWPILGSMFMFRLILYIRADLPTTGAGFWSTLAYFFMLPNVALPLFPVVDYDGFRRAASTQDSQDSQVHESGVLWICRGLVHLLLYRFINANFIDDPTEVAGLGDLVQFIVATYLLYLRVSGQFHIAVGILHLFGFNLPATNRLYFLSSGFTDMWRRMNIYWTEFMTKVVFYPTYFRLKRLGQRRATAISAAVVFVVTWLLHSYQWFWLRGDFPLRLQDALFWGILGVMVIRGVVKALGVTRSSRSVSSGSSWQIGLRAAATFLTISVLWSLWSTPTLADWAWLMSAALKVDLKGILLILVTVLSISGLAMLTHAPSAFLKPRWTQIVLSPSVRSTASLAVLFVLAQPVLRAAAPPSIAEALNTIQTDKANPRQNVVQSRGYYEQLDGKGNADAADAGDTVKFLGKQMGTRECHMAFHVKRMHVRPDLLLMDLVPSLHLAYPTPCWSQTMTFSTNQWGMRDKEYSLAKPANTLRIEIYGASHVMGNGTTDGATFEQVVENRLNRENVCAGHRRVEILNFGVDSYSVIQQLAMLDQRGFEFSPDIVIFTVRAKEPLWMPSYLSSLARYHVAVPYEPLRDLLSDAGLANVDRGDVAIPFQPLRDLMRGWGVRPQMPSGELDSRATRISYAATDWAWAQFAKTSAAHGAKPIVLAVDVVWDETPRKIPNRAAMEAAGLPVINLFDAYPEGKRDAYRVSSEDVHPNEIGHRIIADRLHEALLPFVQSTCATRADP